MTKGQPFVTLFDDGVGVLLVHGGKHVFGDGVDHAATDSRARGGLGRVTAILGGIAVTETLEHGDVVAAVAVDRDLILGNTVVARQPSHALALVGAGCRRSTGRNTVPRDSRHARACRASRCA